MQLATPVEPDDAPAWVEAHLGQILDRPMVVSSTHRGGQAAADRALADFDVAGYASSRSVVEPVGRRGASRLSPWIRHGLLDLRRVWGHVAGGPPADVRAFRDELLWQEYARHLYARLGTRTRRALRRADIATPGTASGWDRLAGDMACTSREVAELVADGWISNRGRLWLASEWSVRRGLDWRSGEALMFRSLLDGSRAANRLGWQWTTGAGSGRPWSWTRAQVERLAPGRCDGCTRRSACPVEHDPPAADDAPGDETHGDPAVDALLRRDPDPARTAGPDATVRTGPPPQQVWITAESLGDDDPALDAHPGLPAVFVFDEPLLRRLRLAPQRLVFLAECLADLATRRSVEVHLGDPATVLRGRALATTAAPVPGNRRIRSELGEDVVAVHPWPWLVAPHDRSVRSFSAWRRHAILPRS